MANNTLIWGFLDQKAQAADRVSTIGVEVVNRAVELTIAEYQREIESLMALLVEPTTSHQIRYTLPGGGTLQPLDEFGNPMPALPSGYYDVAFPIQGAGTAWGNDRITRAKMTLADADRFTAMVLTQDADWLARHILAALFTNTTWSYTDPIYGALTIQPLANGDTVTYTRKGGSTSTDDHYLAQANAIGNGADNPYPIIRNELEEHPSNMGDVIAYIPTSLRATTEALSTFKPARDPNVRESLTSDEFVGTEYVGFGDEFIGYDSGVKIVEWKRLPAGFMIATMTGTDPVLGMREHAEPELQGLFPEFQDVDGNRFLQKFIRYAGFGVRNRVGALVYRVGNGSYAIPTGYTAPLKV